jgi:hypothetical protein
VDGEQVIVENIHQHAAEATQLAAHSRATASHHRVRIGEGVDLFVFLRATLEGDASAAQFFSPDDVGQQIAEAILDIRLGEEHVGQPIQATSLQ